MKLAVAAIVGCVLGVSVLVLPASAATRVALVAPEGGEAVLEAVDLAGEQLTRTDGIELLERSEIHRILAEHKMSVAGLVDGDTAVKVGQLLGVDLFAAIETDPQTNAVLAITVFDAATGVRYWDSAVASDTLEHSVQEVVAGVRKAEEKRKALGEGGRVVCMLSMRNIDLPGAQNSFCRVVGTLIERRLSQAGSISVVERKRLEQINQERALGSAESRNELTPATVMLELQIARGPTPNSVLAKVFLTDAEGKTVATVESSAPFDAPVLADGLHIKICEALKSAPATGSGDRKREALRFQQEAKRWSEHGDLLAAMQAADAALALDPDDDTYWEVAASHKIVFATALPQRTNLLATLDAAEGAWDLCHRIKARKGWTESTHEMAHYLWIVDSMPDHTAETHQRVSALRSGYLELWGSQGGEYRPDVVTNEISMTSVADALATGCDSSELYIRSASSALDTWLKQMAADKLYRGYDRSRGFRGLWQGGGHFAKDETYYRGMMGMSAMVMSSPDPIIRLYGKMGSITIRRAQNLITDEQVAEEVREVHQAAFAIIEEPGPVEPEIVRDFAYEALLAANDLVQDPERRALLDHAVFDFMISRNELYATLCKSVTTIHQGKYRDMSQPISEIADLPKSHYPRLIANAGRIAKAIQGGATIRKVYNPEANELTEAHFTELQRTLMVDAGIKPETQSTPWTAARKLVDVRELKGLSSICNPILHEDDLYLLGEWHAETSLVHTIEIVRCNLDGGPISRFGKTETGIIWKGAGLGREHYQSAAFPATVLNDGAFYVASAGDGVFVIPMSGSPVTKISAKDGLPSAVVQALAVVGRQLYMGCGRQGDPTYFVRYGLDDHRMEIIASSVRREQKTPLDNTTPPFFIRAIRHDAARNRLLLTVDCGWEMNNYNDYSPTIGLYEYSLTSGALKQLVRYNRTAHWTSEIRGDRLLLGLRCTNPNQPERNSGDWRGAVEFNPSNDTARIAYAINGAPAGPNLVPGADSRISSVELLPPYLFRDGWMYFIDKNFGRLSLSGDTVETFPELELRCDLWGLPGFMEWVESRHSVVAADDRAAWILVMPGP